MAKTLNLVQLAGNIGNINPFGKDNAGVNVSVATQEPRKEGNDWVEDTVWHNATAYGHMAKYIQDYANVGDFIVISGKLSVREYTDKAGNIQKPVSISIKDCVLKSKGVSKGQEEADSRPKADPKPKPKPEGNTDPDDDLPF